MVLWSSSRFLPAIMQSPWAPSRPEARNRRFEAKINTENIIVDGFCKFKASAACTTAHPLPVSASLAQTLAPVQPNAVVAQIVAFHLELRWCPWALAPALAAHLRDRHLAAAGAAGAAGADTADAALDVAGAAGPQLRACLAAARVAPC